MQHTGMCLYVSLRSSFASSDPCPDLCSVAAMDKKESYWMAPSELGVSSFTDPTLGQE